MQDKFQWLPLTFHKEFIHPTYTHIAKNKKKKNKKKEGGRGTANVLQQQ